MKLREHRQDCRTRKEEKDRRKDRLKYTREDRLTRDR